MGECLDCMKQIKSGRCIVDVREFDFRWYWQVKRFWEQVDVKDEDSCWPWKELQEKIIQNLLLIFHLLFIQVKLNQLHE